MNYIFILKEVILGLIKLFEKQEDKMSSETEKALVDAINKAKFNKDTSGIADLQ